MVIAPVVTDWMQNNSTTTIATSRFMAVHIDYNNRAESGREAAFVETYCRETLHIPYRVRRIDEVTRGVTKRDEYERHSREIRYDAYKAVMNE
jgi:tRNA(Ile)-lysidine synthase TilS/MesJ